MKPSNKNLYIMAGVPKLHRDFRPIDNTSKEWQVKYSRLKELFKQKGIIGMLGDRGRGKTQASACLIGYCAYSKGWSAKYTKAFDIFVEIRGAFSKNTEYTEAMKIAEYTEPFLLVVDAYEVRGDTEFENRCLDNIIDKRYDDGKPTVLISNDDANTFAGSVGSSIVDRIKQSGGVIVFGGDSFRGVNIDKRD